MPSRDSANKDYSPGSGSTSEVRVTRSRATRQGISSGAPSADTAPAPKQPRKPRAPSKAQQQATERKDKEKKLDAKKAEVANAEKAVEKKKRKHKCLVDAHAEDEDADEAEKDSASASIESAKRALETAEAELQALKDELALAQEEVDALPPPPQAQAGKRGRPLEDEPERVTKVVLVHAEEYENKLQDYCDGKGVLVGLGASEANVIAARQLGTTQAALIARQEEHGERALINASAVRVSAVEAMMRLESMTSYARKTDLLARLADIDRTMVQVVGRHAPAHEEEEREEE